MLAASLDVRLQSCGYLLRVAQDDEFFEEFERDARRDVAQQFGIHRVREHVRVAGRLGTARMLDPVALPERGWGEQQEELRQRGLFQRRGDGVPRLTNEREHCVCTGRRRATCALGCRKYLLPPLRELLGPDSAPGNHPP